MRSTELTLVTPSSIVMKTAPPQTFEGAHVTTDTEREDCLLPAARNNKDRDDRQFTPKTCRPKSNEVGSSNAMEKEGFIRSMVLLAEHGLAVDSIITDRHPQIQKYLTENMPDVRHYYDVWHVAKGFIRSIEKVSKECPEVKPWLKSISNHMYWCAASSHGQSPDVIVAKWQSLGNHIQNKHSNHGPLFPACLHDDPGTQTKPKKWLKPSTKGCEKVVDMINKTRVLRDVRKLSPGQQTSNVEAFHSLIIRFAPKSVHFSFLGMLTRLCLAAMHYNENAGHKQAKNRDGELVFIIRYPKFKHGGYTLQAKKVHPTFEYVDDLMNTLFQKTLVDPTHLCEEWKDVQARVPATLSSTFQRPIKADAVEQHSPNRAESD
ncbi:uncharacterized protein KZ484_013238 [Pholidichthys leucotaenia]